MYLFLFRATAHLLYRIDLLVMRIRSWYWRNLLLARGARCGVRLQMKGRAYFAMGPGAKIAIGNGVYLAEGAHIFVGPGASLSIEDGVFIGNHSTVAANAEVRIGRGSQIAHHVTIIDSDHRFSDPSLPLAEQGGQMKRIVIGSELWIGASAVILKGVTIGQKSVVGAGTIVTKDVKDRSVVVGSSSRVLE